MPRWHIRKDGRITKWSRGDYETRAAARQAVKWSADGRKWWPGQPRPRDSRGRFVELFDSRTESQQVQTESYRFSTHRLYPIDPPTIQQATETAHQRSKPGELINLQAKWITEAGTQYTNSQSVLAQSRKAPTRRLVELMFRDLFARVGVSAAGENQQLDSVWLRVISFKQ